MRWATYFAVLASVLSVGLALGVSMPLVSLRLESWGYGNFAIGIMAAMPAFGVLLGAKVSSRLASWLGTANLMRLCLWAGAISIGLLAVLPSYPVWLVLRLMIGVILTIVFILGESWINQLVVEQWRGRLVALYGCTYALSQLSGPLLLGVLVDSPELAEHVRNLALEGMAPPLSYEAKLKDGNVVWVTEDNGRLHTLSREPGSWWRRFNAWFATRVGLERML